MTNEIKKFIDNNIDFFHDEPNEDVISAVETLAMKCVTAAGDVEYPNEKITSETTKLDMIQYCIKHLVVYGHTLWKECINYINEKGGSQLNVYIYLMLLQASPTLTGMSDKEKNIFIQAFDAGTKEIEELEGSEAPKFKDGENFGILINEYMRLMQELGTFYRDRGRYKTDEERRMHDRIMEIYNCIVL